MSREATIKARLEYAQKVIHDVFPESKNVDIYDIDPFEDGETFRVSEMPYAEGLSLTTNVHWGVESDTYTVLQTVDLTLPNASYDVYRRLAVARIEHSDCRKAVLYAFREIIEQLDALAVSIRYFVGDSEWVYDEAATVWKEENVN